MFMDCRIRKKLFLVRKEMNVRAPMCWDFGLHAQLLLGGQWRGYTAPPQGPEKGLPAIKAISRALQNDDIWHLPTSNGQGTRAHLLAWRSTALDFPPQKY